MHVTLGLSRIFRFVFYIFRKCLVIFSAAPESSEIIKEKMTELELELVENEEMTLTEEQVEALVEDLPETEETDLEEMRAQLTAGPVEVFAYRNMAGDIDEGEKSGGKFFRFSIYSF